MDSRVLPKGPKNEAEAVLFSEIVRICRNRILQRLRSRLANFSCLRNKNRPFLATQLEEVLDLVKQHANVPNFPKSKFFRAGAGIIQAMKDFDSPENEASNQQLGSLVEAIYCFSKRFDIARAFASLPSCSISPSTPQHLEISLFKISGYREAARTLLRMAAKHTIFRSAQIISPDPAQLSQPTGSTATRKTSIQPILERLGLAQSEARKRASALQVQLGRLCNDNPKVHAEMQLAHFYELHPPRRHHPRVIAATKDTCFLCNEFIKFYGRYFTPRCHGRLYPGWGLPAWPDKLVMQRFVKHLDELASNCLRVTPKPLPTPYESKPPSLMMPSQSSLSVPLRVEGDVGMALAAAAQLAGRKGQS